jgi:hypothetical protein
VPQTNGILLSAPIATTYFVLSILSFIGLGALYETVNYGLKPIMYWTRIITLVYGIILCVLGLLIFIIELSQLKTEVEGRWAAMSQYQKEFFAEDITKLESVR